MNTTLSLDENPAAVALLAVSNVLVHYRELTADPSHIGAYMFLSELDLEELRDLAVACDVDPGGYRHAVELRVTVAARWMDDDEAAALGLWHYGRLDRMRSQVRRVRSGY